MITNVIGNSLIFTEHGAITSIAEVDDERHQMIVRVKDTGKSITRDILPKQFTKLVTQSEKGARWPWIVHM